jgi:hypothetical protein
MVALTCRGGWRPAIQSLFPQPDIFMAMVRGSYAPVYRHKRFEFGEARASDGQIAQRVHIVDADGVPWEALYTLEQQPDGSLKITGCMLLKAGQAACAATPAPAAAGRGSAAPS